jgi:hypothetical protein
LEYLLPKSYYQPCVAQMSSEKRRLRDGALPPTQSRAAVAIRTAAREQSLSTTRIGSARNPPPRLLKATAPEISKTSEARK